MFAIQIQNPILEKLAKEVFSSEPITESPQLLEFLQQQKINKDLKQSISEMEQGKTVNIDDAFNQTFNELGV